MNGMPGSPVRPPVPAGTHDARLAGIPGLRAGISRFPVDGADRSAARFWVSRAAGVSSDRVALLDQVHGARVVTAPWSRFPEPLQGDALVTSQPGLALAIRVADCAPLWLASVTGEIIGLVHAGWRGLLAGVIEAGVAAVAVAAASEPSTLTVGIGPCLGPCCYRVGEDFADLFPAALLPRDGQELRFDLPGAVRLALRRAGLTPTQIGNAPIACSACGRHLPEGVAFHSHRASAGARGRNIAYVVREGGA